MILAFLWFFLSTGCFLGTVHFWVASLMSVFCAMLGLVFFFLAFNGVLVWSWFVSLYSF